MPIEQVSAPRVHGEEAATMQDDVLPARWKDIYRVREGCEVWPIG
jgi:hypothetical protein